MKKDKAAAKAEEKKLTKGQKVLKEIREWVVSLAVALLVVFLIKSFIFTPIRVDGESMHPTLSDGERLFVTVYDVKLYNGVERGDVIICNYYERTNKDGILGLFTVKTNFVKRVVGLPGDTVKRASGVTYINGVPLDPSASRFNGQDYDEYVLGEDEYFVVGDNRYNSHDSRKWDGPGSDPNYVNNASGDVGPITYDMIVGHVRSVFWPLSEWRGVATDAGYTDARDK